MEAIYATAEDYFADLGQFLEPVYSQRLIKLVFESVVVAYLRRLISASEYNKVSNATSCVKQGEPRHVMRITR